MDVLAQAPLRGAEVGGPSDVSLFRTGTGSKPGGAGDGVSSAPLLGAEDDGSADVVLLGGSKPGVINTSG
jgi:hypothetical protein